MNPVNMIKALIIAGAFALVAAFAAAKVSGQMGAFRSAL